MSPHEKPAADAHDASASERANTPTPAEQRSREQALPSPAQEAVDPVPPTGSPEDATRCESEPEGVGRPSDDDASDDASDDREQGEISEPSLPDEETPPLPDEAPPPPLPAEPAPGASGGDDDGWDYRWDYPTNRYIFFNRITGQETLENPRVPTSAAAPPPLPAGPPAAAAAVPEPPVVTGYNPAIHGDYDPNAWYAKLHEPSATSSSLHADGPAAGAVVPFDPRDPDEEATTTALFNRFTGQYQTEGAGRHGDEAKGRRQMNAYFDVDAAANAHDGRSLKAERSGKKPSRNELKQFKEKRKARKEEKRRAWLRD